MKNESLGGNSSSQLREREIAKVVRAACVQAAQQGYERASADGLCDEGALEVALDAIRSLDLDQVLRELKG